jgi:hypothetical protein
VLHAILQYVLANRFAELRPCICVNADNISITASGTGNMVGTRKAGSDKTGGTSYLEERDDAALRGRVEVAVQTENDASAEQVRQAFEEFSAGGVSAT